MTPGNRVTGSERDARKSPGRFERLAGHRLCLHCFVALALIAGGLTGCQTFEAADQRASRLAAELARHQGRLTTQQRGGIVELDQPFYGRRQSVPARAPGNSRAAKPTEAGARVESPEPGSADGRPGGTGAGLPLPAELEQDLGIEIASTGPAGFEVIRDIVAGASGLDVSLRTTYPTGSGVIDVPVSGRMDLDHRGPLSVLLNRIGSRFDLAWSFDGSAIRFDRMITVIHDVPLPPATGSLGTKVTGVRTGTSTISIGKDISVDPWGEIGEALDRAAAPPASATLSRNAGKITVFGPPSVQEAAGRVIKRFSDVYSKRIGLEIATYFIDAGRTGEQGFGGFLRAALGHAGFTLGRGLTGNSDRTGSIAIIGGDFSDSVIDFRALASESDVVDHRLTNTIGQSGVIAPVSLLSTQNYVRESASETDSNGAVTRTVKVDSIDTGLSIFALPRLIDDRRIQPSLWMVQASLNSLKTLGSIQLPKTDHRALEYTVVLAPGETLIIGGYEQETVRTKGSGGGVAGWLGFGGSRTAERVRTAMVVLIRPTIIGG